MQQMQHFPIDNILNILYCIEVKSYLNASEIAKLLKVDRATVTRWAQQGKLKGAIKIGKSYQWRIPMTAFENLIKNQK
jgi:excisionase family DNA binding protein